MPTTSSGPTPDAPIPANIRQDSAPNHPPQGDRRRVHSNPGPSTNLPGLITVQLPPNLTKGQTFKVVVRQVDGRKYKVIDGIFSSGFWSSTALGIPAAPETRNSVLKHIALSIPQENRWHPSGARFSGPAG